MLWNFRFWLQILIKILIDSRLDSLGLFSLFYFFNTVYFFEHMGELYDFH